MLGHQHFALIGQRPSQRLTTERPGPTHQINDGDLALVIDADFLEIEQQPGVIVPKAMQGVSSEQCQGQMPFVGLAVSKIERPAQAFCQTGKFRIGQLQNVRLLSRRGIPAGLSSQDRRPNRVACSSQFVGSLQITFHDPFGPPRSRRHLAVGGTRNGGVACRGLLHDTDLKPGIQRSWQSSCLKQLVEVQVLTNDFVDQIEIMDRGEIGMQPAGGEFSEFAVHGGELDVDLDQVGLRKEQVLASQDRTHLIEF